MIPVCFFEDATVHHLRPLVDTRAAYQLRSGIRSLYEAQRAVFGRAPVFLHSRPEVAPMVAQQLGRPVNAWSAAGDVVFVNGRWIAEEGAALDRIRQLAAPDARAEVLVQGHDVVAARFRGALPAPDAILAGDAFDGLPAVPVTGARFIGKLWHLIDDIRPAIVRDAKALGASAFGRDDTAVVSPHAILEAPERIALGAGAEVRARAVLNASDGPIVVGEGARIMEGAVVRGPAYIGAGTVINVHADIVGSAIGYGCKVGGEVHDAVIHARANKAHSGFLGHSYVGAWCNLGADTTVSNLKNDYGEVSLYNEALGTYEPSGRQFLGLIMADHSKTGIHTMINTGTVVGVSCNLFGSGYLPRRVPAFSWGGADGFVPYRVDKALDVAEVVMARRNSRMSPEERARLVAIYETSQALTGT